MKQRFSGHSSPFLSPISVVSDAAFVRKTLTALIPEFRTNPSSSYYYF